jgi:hypothetical protein
MHNKLPSGDSRVASRPSHRRESFVGRLVNGNQVANCFVPAITANDDQTLRLKTRDDAGSTPIPHSFMFQFPLYQANTIPRM